MSLEQNMTAAGEETKKVKSPSEIRREKEKEEKKKKKKKEKKEKEEKARKKKIADADKAYGLRLKASNEFVKKAFTMGFNLGISLVEHVTGEFKKGKLEEEGVLAHKEEEDDDAAPEDPQKASAHALARDLGYEQPEEGKAEAGEGSFDIEVDSENRIKDDLRSYGMDGEEVDKLDMAKAWQAHQEQTLVREIANSKKEERTYTFGEARKEFGILRGTWEKALFEMEKTTDDARMSEILEIVVKEFDDPMPLQAYLAAKKEELSAEEIALVQCSIEIKKFRAHAKEQLYGKQAKEPEKEGTTEKKEFSEN